MLSFEIVAQDWSEPDAEYRGKSLIIKLFGLLFVIAIGRKA